MNIEESFFGAVQNQKRISQFDCSMFCSSMGAKISKVPFISSVLHTLVCTALQWIGGINLVLWSNVKTKK